MCRSLPPSSIIFLSNSLSVIPDMVFPFLQNSFPKNFLERRKTRGGLSQATSAKREHPLIDCFLLEFQRRRPHQNQFAQLIIDFHDLVEADPALVSALIAGTAPFTDVNFCRCRFLLSKTCIEQRLAWHFERFPAVLANPSNQALRADQVDRGRDEKGLNSHIHQAADGGR